MAIREIRILASDGKVVDADRDVHVTTRGGQGGPDRVKWVVEPAAGGAPTTVFRVVFGSSFDPFVPGKIIDVPSNAAGSNPETVQGMPASYKYSVVRVVAGVNTDVTDDPNIIIKS